MEWEPNNLPELFSLELTVLQLEEVSLPVPKEETTRCDQKQILTMDFS